MTNVPTQILKRINIPKKNIFYNIELNILNLNLYKNYNMFYLMETFHKNDFNNKKFYRSYISGEKILKCRESYPFNSKNNKTRK